LKDRSGVAVLRVTDRSPAARAGVAPGMVIERVNGRDVESLRDLENAARGIAPGQAVSLVVRLPDGNRTIINYRVRG